jgi:hypothetical protein
VFGGTETRNQFRERSTKEQVAHGAQVLLDAVLELAGA